MDKPQKFYRLDSKYCGYFGFVETLEMGDHDLYVARIYKRGFEDDGTVDTQIKLEVKVTSAEAKYVVKEAIKSLES